jgi:peptidoglycan/LPS O-acetylase OafA/YrhL
MWINSRPMVKLGDLTYAFYICHIPVLFTAHAAFAGEWVGYANQYTRTQWGFLPGLAFLIGAYALCVSVAWILYTTIEMPTKRRWSQRRVRPATAVSGPSEPQLQK